MVRTSRHRPIKRSGQRSSKARKKVMLVLDTADAPHSNLRLPHTENYATADAGYAGPARAWSAPEFQITVYPRRGTTPGVQRCPGDSTRRISPVISREPRARSHRFPCRAQLTPPTHPCPPRRPKRPGYGGQWARAYHQARSRITVTTTPGVRPGESQAKTHNAILQQFVMTMQRELPP